MSRKQIPNPIIANLLQIRGQWTLEHLKDALQAAIELEFATLPPYLSAYWSIKDPKADAANLIFSIFIEEMLHLGLACNMLVAIGGKPQIIPPKYPGSLPFGIIPNLKIELTGLNFESLSTFLTIEAPDSEPSVGKTKTYLSISNFYDAILEAFQQIFQSQSTPFPTDYQRTTTLGIPPWELKKSLDLYEIKTLDDVKKAITEIKEQGEGTTKSPDSDDFGVGMELAHYYKFAQIYKGLTLTQKEDKTWIYGEPAIVFPDTYPLGVLPEHGWSLPLEDVQSQLDAFNAAYRQLIDDLELAWSQTDPDGTTTLSKAINADMYALKDAAGKIVQTPLPNGSGLTYVPEFRYFWG